VSRCRRRSRSFVSLPHQHGPMGTPPCPPPGALRRGRAPKRRSSEAKLVSDGFLYRRLPRSPEFVRSDGGNRRTALRPQRARPLAPALARAGTAYARSKIGEGPIR
jgi:hypothetical protein